MKKILFLFFLAGVLPALLWAQQGQGRVVTGIVKDANGPLSGATVMEKGRPANTVAADENGKFRIVLHDGTNTLVISYLNYQKQEVPIKKNARDVEVVLQQSTAGMDEAIVVGFGKKKRITNTGAVFFNGGVLSNNLVDGSGGAVGSTGDILVVRSQVDGNTTDGDGGALYADEDGDVTVIESLIDGSTADGPGGAIFFRSLNSATAPRPYFERNRPETLYLPR